MTKFLRILLFSLLFLTTSSLVYAQYSFSRIVGDAYGDELFWSIGTQDGNYLMTGYLGNGSLAGQNELLVQKMAPSGQTLWAKGIPGGGLDYGCSVREDGRGGYIFTGYTTTFGLNNDPDMSIFRMDSTGQLLWFETFGGNQFDVGEDIVVTSDGNFVAVGHGLVPGTGDRDILIAKVDSAGNPIWENQIGGSGNEFGMGIIESLDGNLLVVGKTTSFTGDEFLLTKIDQNGSLIWAKSYKLGVQQDGMSLVQAADSSIAILGSYNGDFCLMRLDRNGNLTWTRVLDHGSLDVSRSLVRDLSGGYAFAGFAYSPDANADLIHVDDQGNLDWAQSFSLGGSELALRLTQTTLPDTSWLLVGARSGAGDGFGLADGLVIRMPNDGTSGCEAAIVPTVSQATPVVTSRTLTVSSRSTRVIHTPTVNNLVVRDSAICERCELTAEISAMDSLLCEGDSFTFMHNGPVFPGSSRNWWVDSTQLPNADTVGFAPNSPGEYTVHLEIMGGGCSVRDSLQVTQWTSPTANFDGFSTQNYAQFYDSSQVGSSGIMTWQWDFGDSTFDSVPNPDHYFSGFGNFLVCLTVTDSNGCSDQFCDTMTIFLDGREGELAGQLNIFPNPVTANSFIFLENQFLASSGMNWKWLELSGREIKNGSGKGNRVPVPNHPAGILILEIRVTSGQTFRRKVLIR